MDNLTYITHPNPAYRNNPLIEVMGYPFSATQLHQRCDVPFNGQVDLELAPAHLHDYYIRTAIDQLVDTYVVQDEAYTIYETLRRMIEAGYKHRNPLGKDNNELLEAVKLDKDEPLKATHLKRVNGGIVKELQTSNFSYVLSGLSGRGKTTLMVRLLEHIEQVHHHQEYVNQHGEHEKCEFTQITYLYIQLHERRTQKDMLKHILGEVDAATGQDYRGHHERKKSTADQLITAVRQAFIIHGVGMLIIDEAQNFAKPPPSVIIGNNEKTTMKFVEEIFNRVRVPLLFVGTLATLKVFGKEMTIGRRATTNGSQIMLSCPAGGSFWIRLCERICQTGFLKNQTTSLDIIRQHLWNLTQGIPAVAVSLVKATLCHLTKLAPQNQDLGLAALNDVYAEQFHVLNEPLKALRKEQYHRYEDFEVMSLLADIEQDLTDTENDNSAESEISPMAHPAVPLEDEANVSVNAPKKKAKKSSQYIGPKIKDVATAQALGVSEVMATLGHHNITTTSGA